MKISSFISRIVVFVIFTFLLSCDYSVRMIFRNNGPETQVKVDYVRPSTFYDTGDSLRANTLYKPLKDTFIIRTNLDSFSYAFQALPYQEITLAPSSLGSPITGISFMNEENEMEKINFTDWKNLKKEKRIESRGFVLKHTIIVNRSSFDRAEYDFQYYCSPCHIESMNTFAPIIQNSLDKYKKSWYIDFILDEKSMREKGDSRAIEMEKYGSGPSYLVYDHQFNSSLDKKEVKEVIKYLRELE